MSEIRLGIRSETKNRWERRAPLTPADVRTLIDERIPVVCQPSSRRVYTDAEYQRAGARVSADLSECTVILGVKQLPVGSVEPGHTYLFFSHTHKAQPDNMPLLKAMLERECTLIDYELITDDTGQRMISFGRYAGLAGMIDALWALGRRLEAEGIDTPLRELEPAWSFSSLDSAKACVASVGRQISSSGLGSGLPPLVCAIAGSGNSARGAQEIYDLLPARELRAQDVTASVSGGQLSPNFVYRCSLPTSALYERIADGGFDRREYGLSPELYRGRLEPLLAHVDLLVHAIYWEEPYPRLVTREALERLWSAAREPRLRLIADISCDIGGSVEATVRSTSPDSPTFLYETASGRALDAWTGSGPLVLAVDNLPCELPREASEDFGNSLLPYVLKLMRAMGRDARLELDRLPGQLRRATIVHGGRLTEPFTYLTDRVARDAGEQAASGET
jgi:alpha-aminoadipic semialdehyde synthase